LLLADFFYMLVYSTAVFSTSTQNFLPD
jgi:hypothetical protein